MPDFWIATCAIDPDAATAGAWAQPIAAARASRLAIEVLHEAGRYVVLLSTADHLDDGGVLQCRIGFANDAGQCCLWRSRGFPVVDAAIGQRAGWLEVRCAFFPTTGLAMDYGKVLLALQGVRFEPAAEEGEGFAAAYEQFQEAPEAGRAARSVLRRAVRWEPVRSRVRTLPAQAVQLRAPCTRIPSLVPLQGGPLAITHAWSGRWEHPAAGSFPAQAPHAVDRAEAFGAAAFRFGDVETIAFYMEVDEDRLQPLLDPLNAGAAGSGRFRVAGRDVLVQLLRYGQMRLAEPARPPQTEHDVQCQHELLVRLRVRAEEDEEGALPGLEFVHVPVIFVDNPWSKLIGRDLQGFDKRLADFCVPTGPAGAPHRLRPDGWPVGAKHARPLHEVTSIHLVDRVGTEPVTTNPVLLRLAIAEQDEPAEPESLQDEQRVLFRKRARIALRSGLASFDSLQATPVDPRDIAKAWIPATCTLDDLRDEEAPPRLVSLTFHALPGAPAGWGQLCTALGVPAGGSVKLFFHTLEWHRATFSMHLEVRDG